MKTQLTRLAQVKQGLHATQALFIFIAWALTLAVLTKDGGTGSSTWFYFALCFITTPALVYQVMVPVYPRARRFANVYAYATIDVLFTILWFSASVAVAAWNSAGISEGKSANTDSDGSCKYFAFGDATKCSISKSSVGFGIMIFFMFAATSAIAVLFCRQYRQTGVIHGIKERSAALVHSDDPSKDVWSTNIEERDPNDYEEPDERRKYGQLLDGDGQGLLHGSPHSVQEHARPHPGAPLSQEPSWNSLHSGHQYDRYVPSALSPGGYEESTAHQLPLAGRLDQQHGQADYPPARYDRI